MPIRNPASGDRARVTERVSVGAVSEAYAPAGNEPQLFSPELLAPDALYELGLEWHRDSIRFFLVMNGVERDLGR
jgi:hypothetical protein